MLAASIVVPTIAHVAPAAASPVAEAALADPPTPAAAAGPAPSAATAADIVRITFDGSTFSPFVTRVEPGTPLLFVNEGGAPITIDADGGAFSLSPIPPGGGGAVTWSEAGALTYRETTTGATGNLVFGTSTFPGAAPTDLANAAIPDGWPPLETEESFTVDPLNGVPYSTSRLLVTFSDTATVADAEAALARAGALIIGGSPTAALAVIAIADQRDHNLVRSVLAQLDGEPAVDVVTRSHATALTALPEPVDRPNFTDWTNEPLLGEGFNSGQEAAGFPQLWNFTEALQRIDADVTTSVWDGGFQPDHPDLAALRSNQPVCAERFLGTQAVCTPVEAVDVKHGVHVTGIVGARQGGDGVGYDGANPVADIVGVIPFGMSWTLLLDQVLDLKQAGDSRFRDLRVINLSMGFSRDAADWAESHREPTCGIGDADDGLPGSDLPCVPWNDDALQAEMREYGLQVVPVLRRAASLGVVIAHSAGNEANQYCMFGGELYGNGEESSCPDGSRALTAAENGVPTAAVNSSFAAASDLWRSAWGPNPVIVVESLSRSHTEGSTERSSFSQTEGFVSAQGYHLSTGPLDDEGEPTWRLSQGTSQAAPTVAGILGAMLALDPSMSVQELRDAVQTFDDTTDPTWGIDVAPRIDTFGSMLAVEGGLLALLDVSDPSADGNRRVVYGPGASIGSYDTETSTEVDYLTEPDGVIDLRDFRRVRDAWLQVCSSLPTTDCSPLDGVDIALDGGSDHPKRDLNFDRCVATTPPSESCPAAESIHPRFDFNGDGKLSRTATHPVNIDGGQEELTDLQVMARLFEPDPTGEGWSDDVVDIPTLLENLLVTGDIEVSLGGLLGAGATDVAITLREQDVDVFRRPLQASEESVIITAHADRPVEIVVQGTKNGLPFEYRESFDLGAGEDVRYDPCGVIRLVGSDSLVAFESTATIDATLVGCDAADLSGVDVDLIATRAGGGGDATVDSPIATGAGGTASTTFTSGLNPGLYTVTATADLPTETGPTTPVESSLLIEVTEGYRYTTIVDLPDGTLGFPSINDEGTVVFTSSTGAAEPNNQVYRYREDALTEIGATVRDLTDATIDINSVDITNDDDVLFQGDNFGAGLSVSETRQWAGEVNVRFPTFVQIFGESSLFSPIDMDGQPAGNASGSRIMPVRRIGEVGTRVAAYQNGTLAEGPQLGADWVRHADNGYTIGLASLWSVDTNAGGTFFSTAIVIGDSNFGIGTDPDRAFLVPLAVENAPDAVTPTPWELLGERPDISPSGDVVAFVGDRGDGPAVFVALRANDEGSFYPPVPITGSGRSGPPELGFDDVTPRHLEIDTANGDHDLRVGVIHHQLGREGLDDDYATIAVFGGPDGPGTPYTGGLYTIDVELTSTGAIAASGVHPVVELGDTQFGATVERIGWHRVLADDETSSDPTEHQLAFWVDTPIGERIIRANWVGDGGGGGPVPFASPISARNAPTALAGPSPAYVTPDPPEVPAVVVSDLTPEIGEVITLTNRTQVRSQYSPGYLTYELPDGQFRVLLTGETQQLQPPAGDSTIEFRIGLFSTFVPLAVSPPPGVPPSADAGGPYSIESGDELVLDASGSNDADGTIVLYEWDLDRDGEFDDATGPSPRLDYGDVEELLCNGLCSNAPSGGPSSKGVDLRVTDADGSTDVAAATVSITVVVQDFTISILPATELINPGGQTTLRVDIGSVGGFSGRVLLEVISPVPDGYTVSVNPWVDAPGSGSLVVRAPADAPEETFDIQVRGTSGTLVHETSAAAEAVFGLIPICFESVAGVVTDAVTGLPVAGVPMELRGLGSTRYSTTGADGSYSYDDVRELVTFTVVADPDDTYFRTTRNGQLRCDDPLTIDLEVIPIQSTTVRGRVVEGVADPTDTSRGRAVVATNTPIPDPTLRIATRNATGAADGSYSVDVELGQPDNRGFFANVTADAPGFWRRTVEDIRIEAGPAVSLDIPLVRACTTQVGAHGRLVDQFGDPVAGRSIRLLGSDGPQEFFPYVRVRLLGDATTDDDGYYSIPVAETFLDFHNAEYLFEVSTPGARGSFRYAQCGAEYDAEVDLEVNVPDPTEPVTHFGTVTGRVVDAVTGEPIENARVLGRSTGPDGRFTRTNLEVGRDQYTIRTNLTIQVDPPLEWYDETITGATIVKDTVTDLGDIPVVPAEFATVEGYVIDALTGEPLQFATVTVRPDYINQILLATDETGYYVRERIKLPAYNEPRTATIESVRTRTDGKFFRELGGEIPLTPGETTRTDFALTQICENVTIRGYVVDAVTGLPIEGASVDTPVTPPEFTDEFGFYEFTGLSAGSYNQPGAYLLTASAVGYITRQKLVAVACGSTITVNWGADTGAGAVFGIVTNHLGEPVPDAQVIAETGDDDTADAIGAYRIEEIPLGLDGQPTEWDVTAVHPDGRTLVLPATVTDGGETELNFVFPEPVEPPNVPPTAFDLTATVAIGSPIAITLAGSDADGDDVSYSVVEPPATGSLDGTAPDLTFTAGTDEGDVTFTYTAFDGEDTSAPATVTITVFRPNTPPVADNIDTTVVAGESVDITLSGSDAENDPLTFEVISPPSIGSLSSTEPNLTYTAPASAGTRNVTFRYRASDGRDVSSLATVTIAIIATPPPNSPPTADDIAVEVVAGESVAITLTGGDGDGDDLTFSLEGPPPAAGDLTGTPPDLIYDAPLDADGEYTFAYRASDGTDLSDPATVTITIEPVADPTIEVNASNDGPVPWGIDVELDAIATAGGTDDPVMYRWDLDGDGIYDTTASPTAAITTTYPLPVTENPVVEACAGALCTTATTEVTVTRRPTELSDPAGGPAQYSDQATIEATLTDTVGAVPIPAVIVSIAIGSSSDAEPTDASGVARNTVTITDGAGAITIGATFAGNALYEASNSSSTLGVLHEAATLSWVSGPIESASPYGVEVQFAEEQDGRLGQLSNAFITVSVDAGCAGSPVAAAAVVVADGSPTLDGIGTAVVAIPATAAGDCISAALTSDSGGTNTHYAAGPISATVEATPIEPTFDVTMSVRGPGAANVLDSLRFELYAATGPGSFELVDSRCTMSAVSRADAFHAVDAGGCEADPGTYAVGVVGVPDGWSVDAACSPIGNVERIASDGAVFELDGESGMRCAIAVSTAMLFVDKVVENGTAAVGDFAIDIFGAGGEQVMELVDPSADACDFSGTTCAVAAIPPGSYTIGEVPVAGYTLDRVECGPAESTDRESVDTQGAFEVAADDVYCVVTNRLLQGRLTVTIDVVNDDGGTAGPASFRVEVFDLADNSLVVDEGCAADGTCADVVLPVGSYGVAIVGPDGYEVAVTFVELGADTEAIPTIDAVFDLADGAHVSAAATADDVEPDSSVVVPTTTTTTTTTTVPTAPPVLTLPPTGLPGSTGLSLSLLAAVFLALGLMLQLARRRT